ncbi:hypothetical protein VPH35_066145 [Triticum aestivum]
MRSGGSESLGAGSEADPYMFWEKVQPLDDEAFDPLANEYPLMLNWSEDEAKKCDAYDTAYGRGNGTIDDVISEKYRQTLIAQQGRKAEEELQQELEQKDRAQKKKDNRDEASSSRDSTLDQIVVEKLEKKGLVFKPNKGSDDDIEYVEHSENWVGKYGPSKYWPDVQSTPAKEDMDNRVDASFTTGSDDDIEYVEHSENWMGKYGPSKYWPDVQSTPAKEDMDNRVDASFTTGNENKLAREKGVHHNTPGTGDEGDPFVIEDNGNSPNPSLATVDTNDFPAITSTPKNMNEVSDGSSADKSEEFSMDSLNTRIKNAKENGTEENDGKENDEKENDEKENDGKENDGKRKRKRSKYCLSPFLQNGGRKRAKKSLFGIRAAMISTDYINEDHIEAAKRAEIANDTNEVNALIGTKHPDVSSWPIREYDMPSQTDGVSYGLFVVKCVQSWDGDDWTFEFDQDEVNASRGRILAEILFSECNTKEVVKEKILKIMEKK